MSLVADRIAVADPEVVSETRTIFENEHLRASLGGDGVLLAEMRHPDGCRFTPALLEAGLHLHERLRRDVPAGRLPVRYLVWHSARPEAWNLGGDLARFLAWIEAGDRAALRAYAHTCVRLVHETWRALDLPIRTVALVRGKAFGGGFEAALACDLLLAERGTRFGLPEALFGLFPGMGAWSLLARRGDRALVTRLVEEAETVDAETLHARGLVHELLPAGEALAGLRRFVRARRRHFARDLALDRVRRRVEALSEVELVDIVEIWVERALALEPEMRRRMRHFARCQRRR